MARDLWFELYQPIDARLTTKWGRPQSEQSEIFVWRRQDGVTATVIFSHDAGNGGNYGSAWITLDRAMQTEDAWRAWYAAHGKRITK